MTIRWDGCDVWGVLQRAVRLVSPESHVSHSSYVSYHGFFLKHAGWPACGQEARVS